MSDRISLESLYDGHADALFGFLLNLTRNEADARDLLQDLFLKIARHPGFLDRAEQVRPFLLRSAYHLFVDSIRRRKSRERMDEATIPEELFELPDRSVNPEWDRKVGAALAELSEDQRAVLHLKVWEECTFTEIGSVLDIPGNTAASRYRYALDKMEALLRPVYKELYE